MTPREAFDKYWLARQRAAGFGDMLTDAEMLAYPERRKGEFHAWLAGGATFCWVCRKSFKQHPTTGELIFEVVEDPLGNNHRVHKVCAKDAK